MKRYINICMKPLDILHDESPEITRASASDLEWAKSLLEEIDWGSSSLEDVFVAKVDGLPVGMARAEFFRGKDTVEMVPAEFFRNSDLATIAGVYVLKEARRKGIGLQLVETVMEAFPNVHEWHLAGHDWVEDIYEKAGFVKIDKVIPALERDFDGQVFMVLQNKPIELTLTNLLTNHIDTVTAVEKLVIEIKNGNQEVIDDNQCPGFNLRQTIIFQVRKNPTKSAWDIAWAICEDALQALQREQISEAAKT